MKSGIQKGTGDTQQKILSSNKETEQLYI